MKIAIDAQTTQGEKTGLGFYTENLIRNLQKVDRKNQYFLIKSKNKDDLSVVQRFIWDQFSSVKIAKNHKADIFHQPAYSAPIFHNHMKIVTTIHDLISLSLGDISDLPFFSRTYFKRWMPFCDKFANRIICDSEHSKKDIMKFLKIPEEKITVIYLAADESIYINQEHKKIEQVKKKYGIAKKYLLQLSTLNPRKNNQFLIKVFSNTAKNFPDYQLVITGSGWYREKLIRYTEELGLEKKVVFTGYVNDNDKNVLYNGAELFLFPSLYEGFGFTPLEAMTCGVPVISSNTSSLPEVVGDAGILLPPTDELGWTRNIKEILINKVLHRNFSQKGLKQARKFSWEKCAKETLQVYEELYENCH